ncbi:MAG TPA: glycoside hydrolase family 43 protein [Phycisphaerales bacterium]|nr:glycoside hydrolase family 43 protein [Phycisphaerales bacterium]
MRCLFAGVAVVASMLGAACASREPDERAAATLPPPIAPNPILPGWYADPEAIVFDDAVWIYPTSSAPYDNQLGFDAFSSRDLATWTRHEGVLDRASFAWAKRAFWAPAVVRNNGRYYFFFAANDIQRNGEVGGIGVGVADSPAGPFRDMLGEPLVGAFHNGAQPIDQFVYRDRDGAWYMFYGGWGRCNMARLRPDFTGFVPFEDGTTFREVTPRGYVEGPFLFEHGGVYYFMWSEGGWTGPDYRVAYAMAPSVRGPFERIGTILEQDPAVGTGAGHHSVVRFRGEHFIVYHRRPIGETKAERRVVCIDKLEFEADGRIRPVMMTAGPRR